MSMKNILFVALSTLSAVSCANSQKINKNVKNTVVAPIDTLKVIYETTLKIYDLVTPKVDTSNQKAMVERYEQGKRDDSLKLAEANIKVSQTQAFVTRLQAQRTEDSTALSKIKGIYGDAIKSTKLNTATVLDVLTLLSPIAQYTQNAESLNEYIRLRNLLQNAHNLLNSDFGKLEKLKLESQNFLNEIGYVKYPSLKTEADALAEKLRKYPEAIKACDDHFNRYFVVWRDNPVGDRKVYLQSELSTFKDYPYLLELMFKSLENSSGTNPLKGKL
jgi:hypothetical protein